VFTLITLISIEAPYPFNLAAILFVFMVIPLIDVIIGTDKKNPNPEQEKSWKKSTVWGPALYVYLITHFSIFVFALLKSPSLSMRNNIIMGVAVGLYNGGLGLTVAHELFHKKEKMNRLFADMILISVWYPHFAVEHIRGHHVSVATEDDPASSRRNESVYPFLLRSVYGSLKHAFLLDEKSVMKGISLSVTLTCLIYTTGGWQTLSFFLIQAIVAITLLEVVNYIEHYGLQRKKLENGRYEKVQTAHSWNSAHKFSNLVFFNLQRHSDHHANAHLPYTVLRHQEGAPQLPTSYSGMILLALVPPLWFRVMNSKLDKLDSPNISFEVL
jgi:alkane 1-monooxygenase